MALQRQFIAHATDLLSPGGTLIYCVCSLEPEEGEAQAAWIAANVPDLVADPVTADELPGLEMALTAEGHVRTHPGISLGDSGGKGDTLDGFFIARFRRR